jgi:hypothetical protein
VSASAAPRRAADCLWRGCASLRANPELAGLGFLQQVTAFLLTLAGFVPLARAFEPLGVRWGELSAADPAALADTLSYVVISLPQVMGELLLALVPASVLWLLAALVYCWFQAGIYGVLHAADGQAPEAATAPGRPASWHTFRAFGWRRFAALAGRWTWRYAGYLHLWILFGSCVLLLQTLILALASAVSTGGLDRAVASGDGLQPVASLAVGAALGCGGALLVGLPLWVVVAAGFWLGQADLPRPASGVRPASRVSMRLLVRRPLAVSALFATFLGACAVAGGLFAPLNSFAGGRGPDGEGATAVWIVVTAAELLVAVLLSTAFAGATVALLRGEVPA